MEDKIDAALTCDKGCGHTVDYETCYAHQVQKVKNLLLEAKLDTLTKANEFYKSESDIIGDYFKGAIGGIKGEKGKNMSRDYQTHYKNFIGKDWQQEKLYTPDKKLVETLHKVLDVIVDDNIALTIDHIVAELMRCEGYGTQRTFS